MFKKQAIAKRKASARRKLKKKILFNDKIPIEINEEDDIKYIENATNQMLDYEKHVEPLDKPMTHEEFMIDFKKVTKDVRKRNLMLSK